MIDTHQKQLGNTLLKIADDLRGAMNADDFPVHVVIGKRRGSLDREKGRTRGAGEIAVRGRHPMSSNGKDEILIKCW
ncbi:MAG: hypothetical protein CVU65_13555 [Deltaproteobacteria bacterium HGW-Deltaproteobacteria-22]|jgi:hypothetical protein|nr:MAG: hypothetical protein CVU65_13555 [Deltaproteobacteria bacterium HGW-Deltaproteobacteria-22]